MTPTEPSRDERPFAFGENWADFAKGIDEGAIAEAEAGLLKLIDKSDMAGASFLDIGCGSGLHALAAIRLGADRVVALDVDPDSVATANSVLSHHAAGQKWTVRRQSVLQAKPDMSSFDVVYSWGVLHHTGDLSLAMRNAAALVAPGGLFVFASTAAPGSIRSGSEKSGGTRPPRPRRRRECTRCIAAPCGSDCLPPGQLPQPRAWL